MTKVAALAALMMVLLGCAQMEPTMHELASDPSGDLVYLKTLDGQLGYHFWVCHREGQREMACERLCDHDRFDDRLCAPEYHHEFGAISRPDSTRLVQREQRRARQEMEEAVDEARDAERQEPRRRGPSRSEEDEDEDERSPRRQEQDEDEGVDEDDGDEPSNGALP